MSNQVADNIDAAVDLMEKRGRITGQGHITGQGYCPLGALREVYGLNASTGWLGWYPAERRALEADLPIMLTPRGEPRPRSLWCFNDNTKDDQVVFDLMRATAKRERMAAP